ncbi:MAG TPA: flagellar hook-associated protein FlgL [Kineosporiaceae bacterium]|jgi:flagellar hook-associated protein 3 FlgL|nr:flagellar hook-associated protein FlgL [Kineosporiaceae bacterium]
MSIRVTQQSISSSTLRGLQSALGRVQDLQAQLSSGKRIAVPSDDPSGTASAMTFRSQQRADEQYLRNIDQVSARLGVTDTALTQLSDRLRAVRELLVQAGNAGLGADSRAALSSSAKALKSEIVDLYNTTYLDRPIFGGTVQGTQALDATGAYIGDERPVVSRISRDATVRVDVAGTDAAADTVPALLDRIITDLDSTNAIPSADFDDLDGARRKVMQTLGDVGARAARVDSTRTNVDAHRLDLVARVSENEDVDLPATIMNLQAQQVAYQSALGASAKILQTSLVDFLK